MTELESVELHNALHWLKGVAGIDDQYIERWPTAAWAEWAKAMHAGRDSINPSVPSWMQPLLGPWHWDFSGPFPCVAQLWPTAHDWFTEADTHDDFTLEVEEPVDEHAPTLDQLREAWQLATDQGATPLMNVSVVPAEPYGVAVTGEVEAFYIVGHSLDPELVDRIARLLGVDGTTTSARTRATSTAAGELLTHAGRDAIDGGELRAWEWMYG